MKNKYLDEEQISRKNITSDLYKNFNSTKPGRPSPRPLKSEKPSTANFSPPKNLSKFLLTLPCPSVISLLGFVSECSIS